MVRALVILACAVMCSCQAFRITDILATAERQIVESPDSALTTMRSIRKYAVLVPEVRARYSLLYSKTLDKNGIDVASDSLIRYSTDYYDLYGTPAQRLEAYYYYGRTQENAKEYLPATLSYLYAEQFADDVDNNYLKGLLYSHLGEMYSGYNGLHKALGYYTKSYECYKVADLKHHQAYQLYRMGYIYGYLQKPELGIPYLIQSKELADAGNYEDISAFCQIALIMQYIALGEYDKAYCLIETLDSKYYVNDVQSLAYITPVLYKLGYKDRAKQLLNKGWSLSDNRQDSIFMHYCQSQIHLLDRQYKKSINEYCRWGAMQNKMFTNALVHSELMSVESAFFKQKSEQIQIEKQRLKAVYTVAVILVIAVSCTVFVYKHRRTKNKERQLSAEIENNIALIEDIRKNFDLQSKELSAMLHSISDSRFEIFDELCNAYYERHNSPKTQNYIYSKVQELIDDFSSNPKTIADIESSVNSCKNGVMTKLREEFPTLKEEEYRLLCYVFAGFSNQAIAVFTKSESGTVATRKSRLKAKVVKSNTPSRALFEQFFA